MFLLNGFDKLPFCPINSLTFVNGIPRHAIMQYTCIHFRRKNVPIYQNNFVCNACSLKEHVTQ